MNWVFFPWKVETGQNWIFHVLGVLWTGKSEHKYLVKKL